jgi:hypothetical protein
VDSVPDTLLLRKSGSAENRTQTSGSVTRNSNHKTTEAVTDALRVLKFWERQSRFRISRPNELFTNKAIINATKCAKRVKSVTLIYRRVPTAEVRNFPRVSHGLSHKQTDQVPGRRFCASLIYSSAWEDINVQSVVGNIYYDM